MSIGLEGYVRVQKEDSYAAAKTDSMIDLPIKAETLIKSSVAQIENANQLGSRVKQLPNAGRKTVTGQIVMDQYPDLMGLVFQLFLGTATSQDNSDGTYTHTWKTPKTGKTVTVSSSIQQAQDTAEAEQFEGCKIAAMTLASDSEGNQTVTVTIAAKTAVYGVARAAVFSFPVTEPYMFGATALTITPEGAAVFGQKLNSYELNIDLQYNTEKFQLGDVTIQEPAFNAPVAISFNCNINADRQFLESARGLRPFQLVLTNTHSQMIGESSSPYETVVTMPKCLLSAETEIPNSNEALTMDLSFDCSYEQVTLSCRDETATY